MAKYGMPGVSQRMTLSVDGGEGVPLDNLPNTGGWDTFRWSKTAAFEIPAGEHELVWKNVCTDGILINGRPPSESNRTSPSVLGTIAERNVVRDARSCAEVGLARVRAIGLACLFY
jgi:hypothetical protein